MRTYAIAYLSFFENGLHQQVVQAESPAAALRLAGTALGYDLKGESPEEILRAAYGLDCVVSAIEVPNA